MTPPPSLTEMYRKMVLIRKVERTIEDLFSQGFLFGTAHCCIGQEAIAVGAVGTLEERDIITSNHRGHGHFLAYSSDVEGLLAELMGRSAGICAGRGGSQHLHQGNFYSNGITAGMIPVATGMALAEKMSGSGACVLCFLGDGAVGEGVFYESLNMASLWQLPLIYVVENNQYAMSTPVSYGVRGDIAARGEALAVDSHRLASHEVQEVFSFFSELVTRVRNGRGPQLAVCETYRLCGHSKSDDCAYRSAEEFERMADNDPLKLAEKRLDPKKAALIRRQAEEQVGSALASLGGALDNSAAGDESG